ncbi:hypothetical protein CPT_Shaeky_050 [Streptomyces phage Shaeky]|uniref:Uncharacterized protein n=1 Tax=Streptomyces phage Shaeky TaxID=2767586 RepID=A0A873WE36_9CAUD|nr:hypothetical protein CPT_Shaeky_050 [Streptomyces phage Shaeky]
MMNVNKAWTIYLGTKTESGDDVDAYALTEAQGTYYLNRGDLFPLTIGTETEATDALLAAAFARRNV